ncbi:hypothetical protein [Tengunoibacter tsumagoiensis]|uniref:DUF4878 domain-containing protein n=1 Tax=Tengunoibacter tsumagoiensis TaxID=2014871 RepID=A0A401ZXU5_9CHLR|nr:hypothetical protein [Tengunoibacter tsumagoiensis]GCE11671.1 hypothetical protein KTT_15300 [Tengunoibacter tsumagoiensis]
MQGRPDQNGGPWERERPSEHLAALNGTSKQRAIPKRPPGMTRLDTAPEIARVPRPKRQAAPQKNVRRRFVILGSIFIVAALFACTAGYFLANGLIAGSGPSTTATDFLAALTNKNYDQAYSDLGPGIRIHLSQEQFKQQALAIENCYGPVSNYAEVNGSAVNQGSSQSFTYTITRSKLSKTYPLKLTLQQDLNDNNNWKIDDYGNDIGPGPGAPSCR